ncbi:GTPase Era [Candidatus Cytomitobacter indipagum]|uniref:GTPase Era n=1 Tax=Candidatus Cytomitobacter indipagum TaxID=2601575 RepID=A0A5C0UED3_9PROT|nr:GTPase Era [Candidatus Cytomitobacter indipagum]QEK38067.1 GTPase Era [Candidatus Cytomitobacter indipagum]
MNKKVAQIAIIGSPNVGKSSLLNHWLDDKVSIVSSKPHTTRNAVFGSITKDNSQIVFVDTPGFARPDGLWGVHLTESLNNALKGVDAILLVIDANKPLRHGTEILLDLALKSNKKLFITIHKCDAVKNPALFETVQWIKDKGYKQEVFITSTNDKIGLDVLLSNMFKATKDGEWLFGEKEKTNLTKEWIGAEYVREKAFYLLHQEIPFHLVVVPRKWNFRENSWDLHVDIIVQNVGHKKIAIGQGASMVKEIGSAARAELMTKWGKGSLFIEVKVDKDFRENALKLYQ